LIDHSQVDTQHGVRFRAIQPLRSRGRYAPISTSPAWASEPFWRPYRPSGG
jgi:hypothetical protein